MVCEMLKDIERRTRPARRVTVAERSRAGFCRATVTHAWHFILLTVLAVAFLGSEEASAETHPIPRAADYEAIQRTVSDYAAGLRSRDAEYLRRALHRRLLEHRIRRDASAASVLTSATGDEVIAATALPGAAADVDSTEITMLTLLRDAAAAKVEMSSCVRLLHLARLDGEWKIVGILTECES